ncbi:hypothetical protein [Intestinibacillus massiliensis]|uniref:hypothetical protein n=1 Tax=Intestinibacillus massiliensis TaxID=1871029 RepID=UPI001179B67A|nr:hypothetical protein [Intestinibacillus massiliensis]
MKCRIYNKNLHKEKWRNICIYNWILFQIKRKKYGKQNVLRVGKLRRAPWGDSKITHRVMPKRPVPAEKLSNIFHLFRWNRKNQKKNMRFCQLAGHKIALPCILFTLLVIIYKESCCTAGRIWKRLAEGAAVNCPAAGG